MKTLTVDVAILGAGTAGLNARRAAEKARKSAVMIDPGPYGTTCARVGCMPSKLLIAAAERAHSAHAAAPFGVNIPEVQIDGKAVMARVRSERDRFVGFVLESIEDHLAAGRLIKGRGRFLSDSQIQVDEHTLVNFKTAVIATGSSPFVPPPYRDLGESMIDNEGLFDMEDLPGSVLVVGTGVIGLELGQSLHRLGVRTSIVGIRGVVGPISDPVVREVAERVFSEEMDFRSDHKFESVTRLEDGRVELKADGRTDVYDLVLMAAGRRPNVMGLGLENVGLDPRKLPKVDPRITQLGDGNIFIAGDVSNFRPLLHEAADEGRIAGMNAATYPSFEAVPRRTPLGVVFSDPQIATVGLSWSAIQSRGHCTGEVDYSRQGRARVMGTNKGWVRIYGDCQDGQLLGAEMFGPATEHTAHLLAWAIAQRLTVYQVLEMPFYHPVVEEGIRTALQDLRKNLHFREKSAPCKELKASM